MNLQKLSDQDLIASTRSVLQTARDAEVNVLRHFREIEERKLWVNSGSLYKFLVRTFNLAEDQVYPRLSAMRLMRSVPEVEEKLEGGELSITNALKAQQVFRAESKTRQVPLEEKREVLARLEHASTREADKLLAVKYPDSKKLPERIKPVEENRNLLQFYVDNETLRQIEELKARFSHQMPSGRMEDLLKILIAQANRERHPRKSATPQTRSRYLPSSVRRAKEPTRKEGCQHRDPRSGEVCGSAHFLQLDHVVEYSRGGANEAENLRWLCGFHNRLRFETGRAAAGQFVRADSGG